MSLTDTAPTPGQPADAATLRAQLDAARAEVDKLRAQLDADNRALDVDQADAKTDTAPTGWPYASLSLACGDTAHLHTTAKVAPGVHSTQHYCDTHGLVPVRDVLALPAPADH